MTDEDLQIIRDRLGDCDLISSHCTQHDVVVQAGSHYGLYPERLAGIFKQVITFEADPENMRNWGETKENITRYFSILGDKIGAAGIKRVNGHSARTFVDETKSDIPVVTIDSLNLDKCDLIYLDIEGYELKAMRGAIDTISRFKPIIAIENKKLFKRNGYGKTSDVPDFFAEIGYKMIAQYNLDQVYAPI